MSKAKKKPVAVPAEPATPPAPPTQAEYFEQTVSMMKSKLSRATETIEAFKRSLDENPMYALEWSNSAFEAAGVACVFAEVLSSIDRPGTRVTLRSLHDYALDQMMRKVDCGSSTSPTANHMNKCVLVAWAQLFDMVRHLVQK